MLVNNSTNNLRRIYIFNPTDLIMKLGVLFSGGKDSIMALDWAIENFEVGCLISIKSKNSESYMFHTPNIDLTKKQSSAMSIPIIFKETTGKKESELKDLKDAVKQAIKKYKIDSLVAGALASTYQRDRIERICEDLKIKPFSPYWHFNPKDYMELLLKKNYKAVISAVAAEGLTKSMLGKEINHKFLEQLKKSNEKYKVHLAGEGGEYETFVYDGPIFKKKLDFRVESKVWDKNSGELKLTVL